MVLNTTDLLPLRYVNKKRGCYIISQYSNPDVKETSKILCKIGKSDNLKKRLDSSQTHLPRSFWTYSLILVRFQDEEDILEKLLHTACDPYLYKHEQYSPRIAGEWYYLPKSTLLKLVSETVFSNMNDAKIVNIHWNFRIDFPEDPIRNGEIIDLVNGKVEQHRKYEDGELIGVRITIK